PTATEEAELEKYLKELSKICYGLTYESLRKLAYEYAVKLEKRILSNWNQDKKAGIEWTRGFMKRHPRLTYRKHENISFARATAFNETNNVSEFFKNLTAVQEKYHFPPHRIWNTDETGITTVLQAPKVIAETGAKTVAQCVSAERGALVTMCGIISASGSSIPPIYIFPRVRMKGHFLNGCVPGAVGYAEKSGWMTAVIFNKLLVHIKNHTNCTHIDNILLLMDNHETHISLEAITYARENGIILLSFPPHCTHKMQPLDRGIYVPFKTKCKISFNDFIASNPGKPISIADIAKLTAEPYLLTFNPKNIVSSFKNTGISPMNSLVYSEDDFKATYATNRPDPSSLKENPVSPMVLDIKDTTTVNEIVNDKETTPDNKNQDNTDITDMIKSILYDILDQATKPKVITIISHLIIKSSDIKPFPTAGPRQGKRKPREKGKSRIYTSTSEKNRIEELDTIKKMKVENAKRTLANKEENKKQKQLPKIKKIG
ncbi:hypothetical protein NQ314_012993, partial [Rhamnusium bicolor]